MRGNRLYKFVDRYAGIPLLILFSFLRKREGGSAPPSRILAAKFSALGDAVLLVPSLKALRRAYPSAEIIVLGTKLTVPFLRLVPDCADRFVEVDVERILRTPWSVARLIGRVRDLRCDAAIDFEQWLRFSAVLIGCSGARMRIGFRTRGQHKHFGFTLSVGRDASRHEAENFMSLAAALTGSGGDHVPGMAADAESHVRAQAFAARQGWRPGVPLVVLHPGCGEHGFPREWEPRRYGELARRLATEREACFVVTGTSGEAAAMRGAAGSAGVPVALYTIESLPEFLGLLSLASLFVSSNNGAMHLAAALGIPQVALHGPTNAAQWGPLNPLAAVIRSACPACPCLDLGFEYHRTDGFCMDQIGVEEVFEASRRLLEGARR